VTSDEKKAKPKGGKAGRARACLDHGQDGRATSPGATHYPLRVSAGFGEKMNQFTVFENHKCKFEIENRKAKLENRNRKSQIANHKFPDGPMTRFPQLQFL
jgi:hypothetical protein